MSNASEVRVACEDLNVPLDGEFALLRSHSVML